MYQIWTACRCSFSAWQLRYMCSLNNSFFAGLIPLILCFNISGRPIYMIFSECTVNYSMADNSSHFHRIPVHRIPFSRGPILVRVATEGLVSVD